MTKAKLRLEADTKGKLDFADFAGKCGVRGQESEQKLREAWRRGSGILRNKSVD